MKIVYTKVLRGPNYWSSYRKKLIEMKLDIEKYEDLPSNMLEGFNNSLLQLLPGLKQDHCSEGYAGGFVKRLEEGTWMGHVIEHVALELQCVAGMECGYGRTRSTANRGVYHVVFSYVHEEAGRMAATAAVKLVEALASGNSYNVAADVEALKKIAAANKPSPIYQQLMDTADSRKIPYKYSHTDARLTVGQGAQQSIVDIEEDQYENADAHRIIDELYPAGKVARIPVIAVTGTNGKTTTTRLLAHIAAIAGISVGFTTTDGIYVNNERIKAGDCSGPRSAELLLSNNEVAMAILECARGGILRAGLGFDHCNISIVTNVSEDHIGLADIENIDQLARVKSVVANSTFDQGYAILNAEDLLVLRMRKNLYCHIALFAIDGAQEAITKHINTGGTAAFVKDGYVMLASNCSVQRLIAVADVPLSFDGTSAFMIQNVLAATLAAILAGFSHSNILQGLRTFFPSVEQTPGRLNVFPLAKGRLIIDYVHNTGGFLALKPFIAQQKAAKKTGVIYATGDRRPEDIRLIGVYAAEMFDEIIINNEHEARGVSTDELTAWLIEGVKSVNENIPINILPDEIAALDYAVQQAKEDELVFASINNIPAALKFMEGRVDG